MSFKTVGTLRYVGMVTIILNDYPALKYVLVAVMGEFSFFLCVLMSSSFSYFEFATPPSPLVSFILTVLFSFVLLFVRRSVRLNEQRIAVPS